MSDAGDVLVNAKSRGSWSVEFCVRSVVGVGGRGACVNAGLRCGECFKYGWWVEGGGNGRKSVVGVVVDALRGV
ncbi:hypothetical protein DRQ25_18060 [Candidatus Fermentibacteria bacterium]|nr:MAG: hypothetical protein DRQ25_18060 [Candidatus Fermentibacteria bacterium]